MADEYAHTAFGEAARIIQELAESIKDDARRASFLAALPIQHVVQQAQSFDSPVSNDHTEPSER